jgi:hypothetical protein
MIEITVEIWYVSVLKSPSIYLYTIPYYAYVLRRV